MEALKIGEVGTLGHYLASLSPVNHRPNTLQRWSSNRDELGWGIHRIHASRDSRYPSPKAAQGCVKVTLSTPLEFLIAATTL